MKQQILLFMVICMAITVMGQTTIESVSGSKSFSISKEVKPPILSLDESSISFHDATGNNAIDAFEKCYITFKVSNSGYGDAIGLNLVVSATGSTNGISYSAKTTVPVIKVGQTTECEIPIEANMNTTDGSLSITFSVDEPNGFGTDKKSMEITTRIFQSPMVEVSDFGITSDKGGTLVLKKDFSLQILVQNTAQGKAENIKVHTKIPENIVFLSSNQDTTIAQLSAGETVSISYQLIATQFYQGSTIPVEIQLTEKYGKYAKNKNIELSLNQQMASNKIEVKYDASKDQIVDIQKASFTADVDKNIPLNGKTSHPRYALIVGCEDYSASQTGANVPFATNDALVFKEYCINTLGVPKENIILLVGNDASKTRINFGLRTLTNYSKIQENEELFFYYSGHGLPDEISKESYIIPPDVRGTSPADGIMLSAIYDSLTRYNPLRATAIIDACFSGAGKDKELVAMKTGRIPPKQSNTTGNLVIFSASSGIEKANPYIEKQHGLLTYLFLKKLQETKGSITYAEMAVYLEKEAALISNGLGSMQTPKLLYSPSLGDSWKMWKFFE